MKKKKIQLSFCSISFPIRNRLFFLLSKFPRWKKLFSRCEKKKKKKIIFMPANVRVNVETSTRCFYTKFYKLSDSITILGITYIRILETTEYVQVTDSNHCKGKWIVCSQTRAATKLYFRAISWRNIYQEFIKFDKTFAKKIILLLIATIVLFIFLI